MILAKIALGLCATVAVGTGYLVQDGFVHVGVDEYRADGTHVHLIVPAMAGPIAAYFVPERDLRGRRARFAALSAMIPRGCQGTRETAGYRVRRSPKLY